MKSKLWILTHLLVGSLTISLGIIISVFPDTLWWTGIPAILGGSYCFGRGIFPPDK